MHIGPHVDQPQFNQFVSCVCLYLGSVRSILHYWSFYFHSDKNYNNPLSELLRHLFLGIVISVISSGISYRSCIALGTELTDTLFCFRTFGIAKKKVHKCIFILETLSLFAKEMEFICL